MIKQFSAACAVSIMCVATSVGASEAFTGATTVAAAKSAGGKQMAGQSIQQIFSGKTLTNPDWTWTFATDGTQSSKANDGSWTSSGVWDIRGNQLCTTSDGNPERCSDIYFLDRDLKFTKRQNKRAMEEWYVSF